MILSNRDFESYSEFIGFSGIEIDWFYDVYYQLDDTEYEEWEHDDAISLIHRGT